MKIYFNSTLNFNHDAFGVDCLFLEVVVQTTTYIQFAFVVLHSRGGVLGAG